MHECTSFGQIFLAVRREKYTSQVNKTLLAAPLLYCLLQYSEKNVIIVFVYKQSRLNRAMFINDTYRRNYECTNYQSRL